MASIDERGSERKSNLFALDDKIVSEYACKRSDINESWRCDTVVGYSQNPIDRRHPVRIVPSEEKASPPRPERPAHARSPQDPRHPALYPGRHHRDDAHRQRRPQPAHHRHQPGWRSPRHRPLIPTTNITRTRNKSHEHQHHKHHLPAPV